MDRMLAAGHAWSHVRWLGRQLFWAGLDVVLPPRCAGCGQTGERWCAACAASLARLAPPLCAHCGYPQSSPGLCARCRNRPSSLAAIRSAVFFEGPMRSGIHRLKYRRDQGLAEALAGLLVALLDDEAWPATVLVPVPLAPRRLRERGYNQSALLAENVSARTRIPTDPHSLRRIRETQSQTQLNAEARVQNVAGAFAARPGGPFQGQRAVLLDDVFTTGATLEACAAALLADGARQVWAVTVGRAR